MNGKSFILGVIVGGAVAGMSTLLSTPSSGAEVRAKVKSVKNNMQETLYELKEEALLVKDQVTQAVEESKTTMNTLSGDLKTSVELWQNAINPHKEIIQQNIAIVEAELEKLERNLTKKND